MGYAAQAIAAGENGRAVNSGAAFGDVEGPVGRNAVQADFSPVGQRTSRRSIFSGFADAEVQSKSAL